MVHTSRSRRRAAGSRRARAADAVFGHASAARRDSSDCVGYAWIVFPIGPRSRRWVIATAMSPINSPICAVTACRTRHCAASSNVPLGKAPANLRECLTRREQALDTQPRLTKNISEIRVADVAESHCPLSGRRCRSHSAPARRSLDLPPLEAQAPARRRHQPRVHRATTAPARATVVHRPKCARSKRRARDARAGDWQSGGGRAPLARSR